jgi:hypothetical protein
MSSLHEVHVSYGNPAIPGEDPSLGNALERVLEAQQTLIERRVDLRLEQLTAKASRLFSAGIGALVGAIAVLAGWFYAIAGVIDALDDHYPRFGVEIGVGVVHIAAGAALTLCLSRRRAPQTASP